MMPPNIQRNAYGAMLLTYGTPIQVYMSENSLT
jgi:hypothetical protein